MKRVCAAFLIVLGFMYVTGTFIVGCGSSHHSAGVYCPWDQSGSSVGILNDQMYDFDTATYATSPTLNNNIIRLCYDTLNSRWTMYWGHAIDAGYASALEVAKADSSDPTKACPQAPDHSTYRTNSTTVLTNGTSEVFFLKMSNGGIIKVQFNSWSSGSSGYGIGFYWEIHHSH